MHCNRCNGTWEWPAAFGVTMNRNVCPFCGNPLNVPVPGNTQTTPVPRSNPNDFVIVDNTLLYYNGYDKTVYVPEGVRVIGDSSPAKKMIKNPDYVKEIVLPESVQEIGKNAFEKCKELVSINLPDSIYKIGEGAFSNCWRLKEIRLPASLTVLEHSVFFKCYSLGYVILPPSLTKIGPSAFRRCSGLRSITFPNSLQEIGSDAFEECRFLDNVIIPNSVTKIDSNYSPAFKGCERLTHLAFPPRFPVHTFDRDIPFMRTQNAVEMMAKEKAEQKKKNLQRLKEGYCPICKNRLDGLFKKRCSKCRKSTDAILEWINAK